MNVFCKNCGKQIKIRNKFCANCGQETSIRRIKVLKSEFFGYLDRYRKPFFTIFGILFLVVVIGVYVESSNIGTTSKESAGKMSTNNLYENEAEIFSSVVNIICTNSLDEEDVSGGSGVIITEEGVILTNAHVIPHDDVNIYVGAEGCIVILPNTETGQPEEMYLAEPILIPDVSNTYDLAFLYVTSAYFDEENQEYFGTYPKIFSAYKGWDTCVSEPVKLGDKVTVYGYPSLTGGYSLTVTDGVVSSFSSEGLIVTSAKISSGNSGGLAVSENGCMIGIPSMVLSDKYESMGVIIPSTMIDTFSAEVITILDSEE